MEFIENHFYKLTKEIPIKPLFQTPNWYNSAAYYGYYGSSMYGSYTISTYDSNGMVVSTVSPYEASKRFTLGRIYQAFSKTVLYDDIGSRCYLDENEIKCFEEVEIGLNEISKKFMEKQINSGKIAFQFNFLADDMVVLKMILNGKHSTCVSLMGVMGQVNEMLHNAYIALRKNYINKAKNNIETYYRWSILMGGGSHLSYGIETSGVFGGRL